MTATAQTVYFVDPAVPGYSSLLAGVPADADRYLLDAGVDGLQHLASMLSAYTGLARIRIVANALPGELYLGASLLDANSLAQQASVLAAIGSHLQPDGQIELYAGALADGAAGEAFVAAWRVGTAADLTVTRAHITSDWSLEVLGASSDGGLMMSLLAETLPAGPVNSAPSFATDSNGVLADFGSNDQAFCVIVLPDDRILLAGSSRSATTGSYEPALARYLPDGSLDTSLAGGGKDRFALGTGSTDSGNSALVQPDGRILVATNSGSVARLLPDGRLDESFADHGRLLVGGLGRSERIGPNLALQPDGRILVAGGIDDLVRYTADGVLDTVFGPTGYQNYYSVELQADGKVLALGDSWVNGARLIELMRFNSDGTADIAFGVGGVVTTDASGSDDVAWDLAIQPDGRILVVGTAGYYGNSQLQLVRYTAQGGLDPSFSDDGKVLTNIAGANPSGYGIALQPDGRILVAGSNGYDVALLRYNVDGSLDTRFDTDGVQFADFGSNYSDVGYSVGAQSDGKILVAGTNGWDFRVARFNADGSQDLRFGALSTSLDQVATFTENVAAFVQLDPSVQVFDAELQAEGHYAGASIRLSRRGGADGSDQFASSGNLGPLSEGALLMLSGVAVGTVTRNSQGLLILGFNANATRARVNEVLSSLTYRNTSENPPSLLDIDWIFSDGNLGAQGSGGEQIAVGSSRVLITPINDAPTLSAIPAINLVDTAADDVFSTIEGRVQVFDPDSVKFSFGISNGVDRGSTIERIGSFGTLTLNKTTGVYVFSPNDAAIEARVASTSEQFFITASDGSATGYASLNVNLTGASDLVSLDAPAVIRYTDTLANDVFKASSGKLTGTGRESLAYGIAGGLDSLYQSSISGSFGSLVVYKSTGDYTYTPNDASVEGLAGVAVDTFTVWVSNGASSEATRTLRVEIQGANDSPAFLAFPLPVLSITERGAAASLSYNSVSVCDPELAASGNYAGASLQLSRVGGANAQDVFSARSGSGLGALTQGANLTVSGIAIGTVTQNSAGTLSLSFNSNATQARLDTALSGIAYANTSYSPPASLTLDWSFSDGFTGAGGTQTAQALTVVNITPSNGLPAGSNSTFVANARPYVLSASDFGFSDIEDGSTLSAVRIDTLPTVGALQLDGVAITAGMRFTAAELTAGRLMYAPPVGGAANPSGGFTFSVQDSAGAYDPSPNTLTINAQPTGSVSISGPAVQGRVLEATYSLYRDYGPVKLAYQWSANGRDIEGATAATFTLAEPEVDTAIRVRVTALVADDSGTVLESVTSAPTVSVANVNDPPQGDVWLSGVARQGEVLQAQYALVDADGVGPIGYEWRANDQIIAGAVGSGLRLGQEQVGKTVTVRLYYTDGHDTAESVRSAATTPVADVNDPPTGNVQISGQTVQGQVLSAVVSVSDPDGLGPAQYQWFAGDIAIDGATASQFTLTQAEVGKPMSVRMSYTDGAGTLESVNSGRSAPITNVNDAPQGRLALTGVATQGETLGVSSTLSDADGMGPLRFEWRVGSSPTVVGEGATLLLTEAMVGQTVSVRAVYVDALGTEERVNSDASRPVLNLNDPPLGVITLAGEPLQGQTLTVRGSPSDADGLGAISYAWRADGVTIPGAFASSLVLTQAEVGKAITVALSYVDGHGSAEHIESSPTTPVGNVNDAPSSAESATLAREDTPVALSVSLFPFSDPDRNDQLASIRIETLGSGRVELDGVPVALQQSIAFADIQAGRLVYRPAQDQDQADSLRFSVSDGRAWSVPATLRVELTPVDDAPRLNHPLDDLSALEDAPFSWTIPAGAFVDVDRDDSLQFIVTRTNGSQLPRWMQFDAATRSLVATPGNAEVGVIDIKVWAVDRSGDTVSDVLTFVVRNVNDAPTLASALPDQQATAGGQFVWEVPAQSFVDVDAGDLLGYSAAMANGLPLPGWLTFEARGRRLQGVPASDDAGVYEIRVVAKDLAGLVASDTVLLTVIDNRAPTLVTPGPIRYVDTAADDGFAPVSGALSGTDPDGNVLRYGIVSGSSDGTTVTRKGLFGTLTLNTATGAYTFTPYDVALERLASATQESFALSVTDGTASAETSLTIDVTAANDRPTGRVVIGGLARQGQTLSAWNTLADVDGLGQISYQWYAGEGLIAGAAGPTLVLGQDEVGRSIHVSAIYRDGQGVVESVRSDPTAVVANVNDLPVGNLQIVGTAMQGKPLSISILSLADADGLGSFHYQWRADGALIAGATDSQFTPTEAERGRRISVELSYTDGAGALENIVSAPSVAVQAPDDASLSGRIYHWKSHALMQGVTVEISPYAAPAAVTGDAPPLFELRGLSLDGSGQVQGDLWVNLPGAVENLNVEIRFDRGSQMVFSPQAGALPESWVSESSADETGFMLAAIGASPISGAVRLGHLALTLAAGDTLARLRFDNGFAGDAYALQAYELSLGALSGVTSTDGRYGADGLSLGQYSLAVSGGAVANEAGHAINSADALAALKLAVGRNPNLPSGSTDPSSGPAVSPYQFIAADFNQDGRISSADALAILKFAVRRPDAASAEWLFVGESQDLWDEAAGVSALSRTAVDWQGASPVDLTQDTQHSLVAVLKGDVNGSWQAPEASAYLPDSYFRNLELNGVGPLTQWGL